MREVRWERMFPDELEQAFAACPLVYFTYGLCEPHGPQNALGLDALKAHAIACAAARDHGGIVAPPDYWHIHEVGGYASWGAANVGEDALVGRHGGFPFGSDDGGAAGAAISGLPEIMRSMKVAASCSMRIRTGR